MLGMGLAAKFGSRSFLQLLAVVLAACGGRYAGVGESGGEAGTAGNGMPGAAGGKSTNTPGTSGSSSVPPGQGGSTTGSGGAPTTGGVGISGGFGVAGTSSVGGTSTGVGGAYPGSSLSNTQLCDTYCSRLATPCPDRDAGTCAKLCYSKLGTAGNRCLGILRDNVACLAEGLLRGSSCSGAVGIASKLCGTSDAEPIECGLAPACDVGIHGDATGCHATTTCSGVTADLHCHDSNGPVLCDCYVSGKIVLSLMTGADSSKAACTDEMLRLVCMQQLP